MTIARRRLAVLHETLQQLNIVLGSTSNGAFLAASSLTEIECRVVAAVDNAQRQVALVNARIDRNQSLHLHPKAPDDDDFVAAAAAARN